MAILIIGLSHHSAPVTVREKFAIAEARIPAVLQTLRDSGLATATTTGSMTPKR